MTRIAGSNLRKSEEKPLKLVKLKNELAFTETITKKKQMNSTIQASMFKPPLALKDPSIDPPSLSIRSSQNIPMSLAQSKSTRVTKIVVTNKLQQPSVEDSQMQTMRRLNKEKIDRMMHSYLYKDPKPKSKALLKASKLKIQLPELSLKDTAKRDQMNQELFLQMPVEIARRPTNSKGECLGASSRGQIKPKCNLDKFKLGLTGIII